MIDMESINTGPLDLPHVQAPTNPPHMETDRPSDDPWAPPAAAYPRWILLDYYGGSDDPDDKTVAHARTSQGHPVSVSLLLAAPPARSRLRLHSPSLPDGVKLSSFAVAAHGDSVLVNILTRSDGWNDYNDEASDYFLYCAGDAAAHPFRPPSLSLLPPCYLTWQEEGKPKHNRYMFSDATALLRRGQDAVVVATLDFNVKNGEETRPEEGAELCLLRSSGDWEWELKRLSVIHDEGKEREVSCWCTDTVIPVGDQFLLWIDYYRGVIYSDVWHETPQLRYVSLPVEPDPGRNSDRDGSDYRNICATHVGGGAVRFVDVFRRCCCGCPGATACAVSRYAFTITTWDLRMDDMTTWEKVGVVDCDGLWSLPGYHGVVPRIRPEYPTVSLDDPDILCFSVEKSEYDKGVDGDLGIWLIEFDTRRLELCSIRNYDSEFYFCPYFIVSTVSQYFDASSCSRTPARRKETDLEAPARPSKLKLPRVASSEEMLATLREIPDLARDDMLKAYGVLVSDESQFKFKSLLALPIDMRKDYCFLIGKLSCVDT